MVVTCPGCQIIYYANSSDKTKIDTFDLYNVPIDVLPSIVFNGGDDPHDEGLTNLDVNLILSRIFFGCLDHVYGKYSFDILFGLLFIKFSLIEYGLQPVPMNQNYTTTYVEPKSVILDHYENQDEVDTDVVDLSVGFILSRSSIDLGSYDTLVSYHLMRLLDDYITQEEYVHLVKNVELWIKNINSI